MRRFPHGGEVLGASPAHPLLVPALSAAPGLSLSRQQALLDLQAIQRIPGLAGYWPADPAYLFEDSAGTIPASVGGVVGAWTTANPTYTLGSEINTSPTTWTVPTECVNNGDGSYTFSATTATRGFYIFIGAFSGSLRVAFTVSGVVAASIRALYRGSYLHSAVTENGDYVFNVVAGSSTNYVFYIETNTGSTATVSNISIKQVTSNNAYQSTTANKPYLRRTPTSNVYWLDSNTSTSALTATLGNLGAACTVCQSGAEGVTFTEGVTISSTYNIAPAYGFNSDIAIFNRALTVTEKALITRYMQRSVPVLGANLVTNGSFDTNLTGWLNADSAWSWSSGKAKAVSAGLLRINSLLTVGVQYYAGFDYTSVSGRVRFNGPSISPYTTPGSSGSVRVASAATLTNLVLQSGDAISNTDVDNATVREIL